MPAEIIQLLDKMDDEREMRCNQYNQQPMYVIPNGKADFRNQYADYLAIYASNLY